MASAFCIRRFVKQQLHVLGDPFWFEESEIVDFADSALRIHQKNPRGMVELAVGGRLGPHAPGFHDAGHLVGRPGQERPMSRIGVVQFHVATQHLGATALGERSAVACHGGEGQQAHALQPRGQFFGGYATLGCDDRTEVLSRGVVTAVEQPLEVSEILSGFVHVPDGTRCLPQAQGRRTG